LEAARVLRPAIITLTMSVSDDPQYIQNRARAKRLLAKMPDELFTLYMEPLIEEHGFPFYAPSTPTHMPWKQLFDCHEFETICELSWKRKEIAFSLAAFHPFSQKQIQGLLYTHILGLNTDYAHIPNTEARFRRACSFIASTGRMPVPLVLMEDLDGGGLRILDGNHRLAAMASFANADKGMVDCWIGAI
jgi:hypothetical protein